MIFSDVISSKEEHISSKEEIFPARKCNMNRTFVFKRLSLAYCLANFCIFSVALTRVIWSQRRIHAFNFLPCSGGRKSGLLTTAKMRISDGGNESKSLTLCMMQHGSKESRAAEST
jgi:hypothetical protein